MKLTGNTRYRISFFKKLILQVEYKLGKGVQFYQEYNYYWKDATFEDLQELKEKRHVK